MLDFGQFSARTFTCSFIFRRSKVVIILREPFGEIYGASAGAAIMLVAVIHFPLFLDDISPFSTRKDSDTPVLDCPAFKNQGGLHALLSALKDFLKCIS